MKQFPPLFPGRPHIAKRTLRISPGGFQYSLAIPYLAAGEAKESSSEQRASFRGTWEALGKTTLMYLSTAFVRLGAG